VTEFERGARGTHVFEHHQCQLVRKVHDSRMSLRYRTGGGYVATLNCAVGGVALGFLASSRSPGGDMCLESVFHNFGHVLWFAWCSIDLSFLLLLHPSDSRRRPVPLGRLLVLMVAGSHGAGVGPGNRYSFDLTMIYR
jgi:hypothetical protein